MNFYISNTEEVSIFALSFSLIGHLIFLDFMGRACSMRGENRDA
jgi:hypothetical protein